MKLADPNIGRISRRKSCDIQRRKSGPKWSQLYNIFGVGNQPEAMGEHWRRCIFCILCLNKMSKKSSKSAKLAKSGKTGIIAETGEIDEIGEKGKWAKLSRPSLTTTQWNICYNSCHFHKSVNNSILSFVMGYYWCQKAKTSYRSKSDFQKVCWSSLSTAS